ncbi:MAG: DNA-directed RNA polymerase subunit alpha [Mycoplasmataceae bacterium]|nr:DNA-directed RNA polymerase subunit alpha [Mycoplasmataceae bacterium]
MERFLKPVFTEIITNKNVNDDNKRTFTIQKLERGFGNTLGIAMRRTLLSSIPSVAPFALELKGATHEFQAINDAQEDVAELILNLKELVFQVDTNIIEPDEVLEIKLVSNKGVVEAKNFELPIGIEIINKDLVLANTSKAKAIDLKLFIMFSKGFKTFEENRSLITEKLNGSKTIIPMDSNFSPVSIVNFKVEEVNQGESYVYERLVLDVETKGNMKPSDVVAMAGAILKNHYATFEELTTLNLSKINDMFEEEKILKEDDTQLEMTIEELNLSVRSENGLEKAEIKTVGELINRPFSALKQIENLGDKSVSEIVEAIQNLGLSFKTE